MKKFVALIVFFAMTIAFATANAEIKEGSFSVTPFIGGYFFEGNQNSKDAFTAGLRAGYNFTENIGVEGFFTYAPSEFKDTDETNKVYVGGIEGIYHFLPNGRVVPFAAIGVGAFHYSDDSSRYAPTNFAVDYGVGLKFFVTENVALRFDVRHVLPLNDKYNDLLCTFGINFAFGGTKAMEEAREEEAPAPAVAPAPQASDLDSDRDGVPDVRDKCPDNPASVVVNQDGCPPDTDNDGVLDYKDNCQDTPAGAKVDTNGCTPDSDLDGVPDYLDKCPGTPSGTVVDKNGCVAVAEKKIISITMKMEFDTAKAVVKKKYHKEIKVISDFMREHPDATATIVGHTDNVDFHHEPERNMRLSQARADSVRQYLVEKFGIQESRIIAIGRGANEPIASNATPKGRQKNRRIVAVIEANE